MALSEREQELLAQLEKQLNDDPTFTSSMPTVPEAELGEGTPLAASPRNLAIGALIAVVGLGVIIAGVSTKLILVGVLGFLIAAGGVYFATLKPKKTLAKAPKTATGAGSGTQKSGFMRNLEDKWDERQGGSRF